MRRQGARVYRASQGWCSLLPKHQLDRGDNQGEESSSEEKAQFRKDYAEPLWEDFKLWAAGAILDVPKDTNIYKALNYMLRNYTAELTNYIDIPDMPLDNNDTERLIRDMVMGKKSYWMPAGALP